MIQLTVFKLAGMGLSQRKRLCSLNIVLGDCHAFKQADHETEFCDAWFGLTALAYVSRGY